MGGGSRGSVGVNLHRAGGGRKPRGGVESTVGGGVTGGGRGGVACKEAAPIVEGIAVASTSMSVGGAGGCVEDGREVGVLEAAAASGGGGRGEAVTEAAV